MMNNESGTVSPRNKNDVYIDEDSNDDDYKDISAVKRLPDSPLKREPSKNLPKEKSIRLLNSSSIAMSL